MPFAGYRDFDQCLAENQDKDDPSAYCGYIKHRTEKATFAHQDGDWLGLAKHGDHDQKDHAPEHAAEHGMYGHPSQGYDPTTPSGRASLGLPPIKGPGESFRGMEGYADRADAADRRATGKPVTRSASGVADRDGMDVREPNPVATTGHTLDADSLAGWLPKPLRPNEDGIKRVGAFEPRQPATGFGPISMSNDGDWLGLAKHGSHDQKSHGRDESGGATSDIAADYERIAAGYLRVGDYIKDRTMGTVQGAIVSEGTYGGSMKIPAFRVRTPNGSETVIPKNDARPLGFVLPEDWRIAKKDGDWLERRGSGYRNAIDSLMLMRLLSEPRPESEKEGEDSVSLRRKPGVAKHGTHDQDTHGHDAFGRTFDADAMLRSDLGRVDRSGRLQAVSALRLIDDGLAYRPPNKSTLALTDKGRALLASLGAPKRRVAASTTGDWLERHGNHDQREHAGQDAHMTTASSESERYDTGGISGAERPIGGVGHHLPTNPDLTRLHGEMWARDPLSERDRDMAARHLSGAHETVPWADSPLTPSGAPRMRAEELNEAHRTEHARGRWPSLTWGTPALTGR